MNGAILEKEIEEKWRILMNSMWDEVEFLLYMNKI
jgi:hypothetical protein